MKASSVLYFEDISPFNEEVFSFPYIGNLSLRQIALVGLGIIVSWVLFSATKNLASLVPLGIFAYVALRKYHVLTTESQIIRMMGFVFGGSTHTPAKKPKPSKLVLTKDASHKLGMSTEYLPKLDKIGKEIPTRDMYWQKGTPVRLQVRLLTPEGRPISKKTTAIKVDGQVIATMATTIHGELEVVFVPTSTGEKHLAIYAEGLDLPVFENLLNIKSL